ncbi:hypothetical protein [Selenomonas ruminantium]|uniref:hypothetical protein n=1 Tax=Selenomonas ruminantium TaxID=971 RepID=UPI00117AC9AE|nr:hypothetical protein [Selenomonas ruminantium]
MQRRPPARSAARLADDFDRQGHGLRMPDCDEREVRPHVPQPSPYALPFVSCLPFSRLAGQLQVSVATWTAQLSTKAAGHPLPVSACVRGRSVRRSDRVPEGGRAGTGGTSEADLPEGETREWSRTVRLRLTGVLLVTRDKGGARCSPCDVDAGSSQRSKVVASASVHQSRERRLGRVTPKLPNKKLTRHLTSQL